MSIRRLAKLLRERRVSSVEIIQETIVRIEAKRDLNALISPTFDGALATAAERDRELARGIDRGPFHGLPIAHKDNIYIAGIPTTAGSPLYRDFIPSYDATVVERFRSAGAISVGKTNMHELAFGITSKNPHFGYVRNPHNRERIAGGSSGGSAVLVADVGLVAATGTDTGGSLRIPAAYCGCVGFKPTYEKVSRKGTIPLSFSLDTVGPLAMNVPDCTEAYRVMSGDTVDLPAIHTGGLRVGVPRQGFYTRLDDQVRGIIEDELDDLRLMGASIVDVGTPDLEEMNAIARVVQLSETAALYVNQRDPSLIGADVWALIEQGRSLYAHEYVNAQRLRAKLRSDMDRLWRSVDVLVTPTTPVVAPPIEADSVEVNGISEDIRIASTRLVRCFNLLGEPALSLPCRQMSDGLPVGLQLISAPHSDRQLLAIATLIDSTRH